MVENGKTYDETKTNYMEIVAVPFKGSNITNT